MYYVIKFFLKSLSLLPLPVLYLLSDFVYFILFYIAGYRKEVVAYNLQIAFPEKTEQERLQIMKEFYHNLTDTFIEIIKILSWSNEEIYRRMTGNLELMNEWKGKPKSVQVITGHFFNWEIANLAVGGRSALPFLGVYAPLKNKVMDRIFKEFRLKTGTILIPNRDFKNRASEYLKQQYALILVGDQNPSNPENGWWLNFFSKPAPMVKGPARGAIMNNTVLFYADFFKVKRGYYAFEIELITEEPRNYTEQELTRILTRKVEASVKKRPANYLWTHRRWKRPWKEEYRNLWVDDTPPNL